MNLGCFKWVSMKCNHTFFFVKGFDNLLQFIFILIQLLTHIKFLCLFCFNFCTHVKNFWCLVGINVFHKLHICIWRNFPNKWFIHLHKWLIIINHYNFIMTLAKIKTISNGCTVNNTKSWHIKCQQFFENYLVIN